MARAVDVAREYFIHILYIYIIFISYLCIPHSVLLDGAGGMEGGRETKREREGERERGRGGERGGGGEREEQGAPPPPPPSPSPA